MSHRRSRLHVKIPRPNDNVTMAAGNKVLADSVFRETRLDLFLDGLKRSQGNSVAAETIALVANSVEMTGLSVNRLDRMLVNDVIREEYGLDANAPRSVYRTVERLGRNSDSIVSFLGGVLKRRYGVRMDTVFMDWTSMYFEASQRGIVRVGYSRDHRPDRPQVTVGLSMDRDSGMPIGLTVNPGNILDVTHFDDTFRQILPLLPKDAMVVFDNGAYSKDNAKLLDSNGLGFVTRLQLNTSDDAFVKAHADDWARIDDDVSFMRIKGNLGRTRYIFSNKKLRSDIYCRYRGKAERDWDEMQTIRKNIDSGRRPRKKYRNSNCFVDTKLSYLFPLGGREKAEAIERAVNGMMTEREGLFVLVSNRPLTASEILGLYRARNDIEVGFRDLKHGIDWRPARCTSEDAVRGRILISFLALFCMSMVRFLYPEFRSKTAESISEELSSFSLTVMIADGEQKRRVFSNFRRIVRRLWYGKAAVLVPKAPGQTTIDGS
ncbi:MAG: transposase [Candidatus Methanomethylophilaceae archaeon]|nr:transposase [Candidatus Methanomethylophilaceae archaeon]